MRTLFLLLCLLMPLQSQALEPSPALHPKDVVRFQLESLQNNKRDNQGIALTFRFASPANKSMTGPLSRFSQLFDHPRYAPMLNHQRAAIEVIEHTGGQATLDVELVDSDGSIHHYRFELSRQKAGEYVDCWMTDAVMWAPRPGRSA